MPPRDIDAIRFQQALLAYFSKVTLTTGLVFAAFILMYYSIWVSVYLFDIRLPIGNRFWAMLGCFWTLSVFAAVGGYITKHRLLVAPVLYFSCLATLGTWCYYALTLRRIQEGVIAADSNVFLVETAVVSMTIMNIMLYVMIISIDRCSLKQERRLRNQYVHMHRAAIAQQIASPTQRQSTHAAFNC